MATNLVDIDPEWLGVEESDIVQKTDATKCKVYKVGDDVPDLKVNKVAKSFMLYTRRGTKDASHLASRNSLDNLTLKYIK